MVSKKITPANGEVLAVFSKGQVLTENSSEAQGLYNQNRYGTLLENGRVQLSLLEAFYLLEKKRIAVLDGKNNALSAENLFKKVTRQESNFRIRYAVFRDLRDRGYIVKTAFKFGADFRVYDRGVKPGEDHAKWVVFPVHESSSLTWHEFSAKNRVAHSTKKRLMMAVVDDENDVTYYEIAWKRP
ncbi:tRNA-intron lyase [Candidatus Woesearchaeota archaeon]|nr:tRNA-intron lyase [Candidatus Woesearchaeota archaeon]